MTDKLATLSSATPELLYIGKGKLYLTDHETGESWDVGNCTRFEISVTDEVSDKFSSQERSAPLYARRLLRRTTSLGLTLDEFDKNNLNLALMGTKSVFTQAATTITDQLSAENVVLGNVIVIPNWGVGQHTGVLLEEVSGPTTLVEGTDYTWLSRDAGVLRLLTTAPNIAGGEDLQATFTRSVVTTGVLIEGATAASKNLGVVFVGDPSVGPAVVIKVWSCALTPSGPIGFISDDYAPIELEGAMTSDAAGVYGGTEDSPLYSAYGFDADA